jgi:hypothetical protein
MAARAVPALASVRHMNKLDALSNKENQATEGNKRNTTKKINTREGNLWKFQPLRRDLFHLERYTKSITAPKTATRQEPFRLKCDRFSL